MANTYTQIRIQFVFVVKGHKALIPKAHKGAVEKYISKLIKKRKHKLLAIYCMPDHTHILLGLHPSDSLSDLASMLKTESTKFIKKQAWMKTDFRWQVGFGAFSYSKSHTDAVVKYILNQEAHHKKQTLRREYLNFLKKFEVDYDPKYLFDFYDNLDSEE